MQTAKMFSYRIWHEKTPYIEVSWLPNRGYSIRTEIIMVFLPRSPEFRGLPRKCAFDLFITNSVVAAKPLNTHHNLHSNYMMFIEICIRHVTSSYEHNYFMILLRIRVYLEQLHTKRHNQCYPT